MKEYKKYLEECFSNINEEVSDADYFEEFGEDAVSKFLDLLSDEEYEKLGFSDDNLPEKVSVEFDYQAGEPGRRSGNPDTWTPDDPEDIEIRSIMVGDYDFSEKDFQRQYGIDSEKVNEIVLSLIKDRK